MTKNMEEIEIFKKYLETNGVTRALKSVLFELFIAEPRLTDPLQYLRNAFALPLVKSEEMELMAKQLIVLERQRELLEAQNAEFQKLLNVFKREQLHDSDEMDKEMRPFDDISNTEEKIYAKTLQSIDHGTEDVFVIEVESQQSPQNEISNALESRSERQQDLFVCQNAVFQKPLDDFEREKTCHEPNGMDEDVRPVEDISNVEEKDDDEPPQLIDGDTKNADQFEVELEQSVHDKIPVAIDPQNAGQGEIDGVKCETVDLTDESIEQSTVDEENEFKQSLFNELTPANDAPVPQQTVFDEAAVLLEEQSRLPTILKTIAAVTEATDNGATDTTECVSMPSSDSEPPRFTVSSENILISTAAIPAATLDAEQIIDDAERVGCDVEVNFSSSFDTLSADTISPPTSQGNKEIATAVINQISTEIVNMVIMSECDDDQPDSAIPLGDAKDPLFSAKQVISIERSGSGTEMMTLEVPVSNDASIIELDETITFSQLSDVGEEADYLLPPRPKLYDTISSPSMISGTDYSADSELDSSSSSSNTSTICRIPSNDVCTMKTLDKNVVGGKRVLPDDFETVFLLTKSCKPELNSTPYTKE